MIFFSVVFVVNLLVNLYIFSRTKSIFPAEGWGTWIVAGIFWLVAFSFMAGRILERTGPAWMAEPLVRTGSWWFGAMLYLALLFLLTDVFRWITMLTSQGVFLKSGWSSGQGKITVVVIYSITLLILLVGHYQAKMPVVRFQHVRLDKTVPGGKKKLVVVSDIHLGMMISNGRLENLVRLVNKQDPDVVLLAGDIFDEDLGPVLRNNMGDLLKNLEARQGVFAVLGNHEFYGDAKAAGKYLADHRITVLRDSVAQLPDGVFIVGREDITSQQMHRKPRKSLDELLAGADLSKPVFVIDHQPYNLAEAASKGIDLQVSGHTHHGQLWPLNYITRSVFEISRGYGIIGNSHFYVSSGYGTWGPPVRTNSRSEIIVLEVTGR